ncbi:MAG: twin-arginine translocase subunit TatC [SAR324 cluster bacterium]|nr:twin-arginine translocase subunit TatC [SAR324 cluster bacterium]
MSTTDKTHLLESEEQSLDPPMPLQDHLSELRKRIMIAGALIFVAFVAATTVEIELNQPILSMFRKPLDARGIPLVFDELTEPFFTYLRIGLYTSLFLTLPFTLGQVWLFAKPALYPKERKLFWPFLILSYPLFIGGGLFGYFVVIPFGYDFFLSFQNTFTEPSLRMSAYLSLTIRLLFVFGLIFELPIVSLFLTRLGVIDAPWLKRNRKYAIIAIFVVAAILTPPDVFTQTLMAGPLIVLYEISILVSMAVAVRKKKEDS